MYHVKNIYSEANPKRTLTWVYEAELSYFVDASKGKVNESTIWRKVGALATVAGLAPRHSFSLVVDGEVCWLLGGFDGKRLLNSVGLYHTKFHKFMFHSLNIAVARS